MSYATDDSWRDDLDPSTVTRALGASYAVSDSILGTRGGLLTDTRLLTRGLVLRSFGTTMVCGLLGSGTGGTCAMFVWC